MDSEKFTCWCVNVFRCSSKNFKVDNSIRIAYTAKQRCNIQISCEDNSQSTSMDGMFMYTISYTRLLTLRKQVYELQSLSKAKKILFPTPLFQSFQWSNQNNVFPAVHMHQSFMLRQITWFFHNMDFLATSVKTTSYEEVIKKGLLITSSSNIWSLLLLCRYSHDIPQIPYHSFQYDLLFSVNQEILLGGSNMCSWCNLSIN